MNRTAVALLALAQPLSAARAGAVRENKLHDAYTLDCNQYRQDGDLVPTFTEWRDAYRLPWGRA